MLFNTLTFKSMHSGLDALWLKQKAISDNIANLETPGYKAKVVSFEDEMIGKTHKFKATVTRDETISARLDGNNVSSDVESMELWRTQAQYAYLTQKISGQFTNIQYVLNNAMK